MKSKDWTSYYEKHTSYWPVKGMKMGLRPRRTSFVKKSETLENRVQT